MKCLKSNASKFPKDRVWLYDYESRGSSFENPDPSYLTQTVLRVVFDGETQRRFSSVKIVVYIDSSRMDRVRHSSGWAIKQLGQSQTFNHSSRDHTDHMPQSDPTLPQLTVAFKVSPFVGRDLYNQHITSASLDDRLCYRDVFVLLESEHPVTPDLLSVSMAFQHSSTLSSSCADGICAHFDAQKYVRIRTVRVTPVDSAPSRISMSCLPTEILMEIFEWCDSCAWQHDLLLVAQVSRQWSWCTMKLLFARLSSNFKHCCPSTLEPSLDLCAFASAFSEVPALALGVQRLDVDQLDGSSVCLAHWPYWTQQRKPKFDQALVAIFRVTKNLERLSLSLEYGSKTKRLSSALPELPRLHTLSIKRSIGFRSAYSISAKQLTRCMSHCLALTSLMVEDMKPGNIGMGRWFLRRPACALTQLSILRSYISNKDLLYITASSAHTLAQVTFDDVSGLTNDGLRVFLNSISQNVISLTIWDPLSPGHFSSHNQESALDVVVDKMPRLQALKICGDVASERMLRRRSKMFVRSSGSSVPVVRLSFQDVPRMWNCTDREWAGWEVVEAP